MGSLMYMLVAPIVLQTQFFLVLKKKCKKYVKLKQGEDLYRYD